MVPLLTALLLGALHADEGRAQAGEPVFVIHRQPAIPLVSLRLSLLVDDPSGLAGAGHLIQHLHYPRLRDRARAVGGKVQIERTSDALIYTVTGPAAELHFLANLLRSTLQPPTASAGARLGAERDLREERLAEWETAGRHLRAALRARLFPADLSAAGTTSSARRLSDEPLDEMWARMYRPERLAVLAVGDMELEQVREAFADLPPPAASEAEALPADTAVLVPLAPAEATRGWFGAGYPVDDLPPAAVSITARLLGDLLRQGIPGAEAVGEHWWTHHGQAVAIVVAAPEDQLATAGERLADALGDLSDALTAEQVADAGTAVRHDMLFYSRTTERMAEVVGGFVDRGGDGDAAQRFYAALREVSVVDVRKVLEAMAGSTAARVDIPPQELNVSP